MDGSWMDGGRKPFRSATPRFKTSEARELIAAQVGETLAWLRKNHQRYDQDGDIVEEPWWVVPGPVSHPALSVRRNRTLMDRVFEHGIFSFMLGLENKGLVSVDKKAKQKMTEAMAAVVISELVGFALVGSRETHSLAKLCSLYGVSDNTKPSHIRDTKLAPLDALGLITMNQARDAAYQITIGPLGEVFFVEIYSPVFDEFWRKSQ